jgi:hypothetical protein
MKELDVRLALYNHEIRSVLSQQPMSLVVDELGLLEGTFRVDLAVINAKLHGYEIKSHSDNLDRLASQQETYNMIFDRMTLVADYRHVEKAVKLVPQWWGLIAASEMDGKTVLNDIWPSRQNLNVDPFAISQLLWKNEALELLAAKGISRGFARKPRKIIWKAVSSLLTLDELRAAVRAKLGARQGWRTHAYG